MLHRLQKGLAREAGFSLIELLVVILIIGILAAIALPAFLGQRSKAQDTEAKSAVRTAATAMKSFYTDTQDYSAATVAKLQVIEPSLGQGQGATLALSGLGADTYTVDVTSKTGNHFKVTEGGGTAVRTCTTAGTAGCPADGKW
jgi:type IV pilus assembly protein PilA